MNVRRVYAIVLWVVVAVMIASLTNGWAGAQDQKQEEVVFYVHCYDVGRSALEELPGIIKVTSGFRNGREINIVLYWPDEITVERMVLALKDAGTFAGTAMP